MSWEGWDGTVWSLNGPTAEGLAMQAGVRGLTMPEGDHTVDETAGVDGGRWRHWRTNVREVFWPLWVWKDTNSQGWLEYDRAFWRTLDPRRTGTWVVTQPNGERRSLTCRFVHDGQQAWDSAPGMNAWARYAITLQAEAPYWLGDTVTRSFATTEPVPLYPSAGGFLSISEGSQVDSASITNDGDVNAWPTWWIPEQTSGSYGVDGRAIDVPFAVASDRLLVVDTSPTGRTAKEIDIFGPGLSQAEQEAWVTAHLASGATDRTDELGSTTKFGALPPGDEVALSISVVGGAGTTRVAFRPHFWRAW